MFRLPPSLVAGLLLLRPGPVDEGIVEGVKHDVVADAFPRIIKFHFGCEDFRGGVGGIHFEFQVGLLLGAAHFGFQNQEGFIIVGDFLPRKQAGDVGNDVGFFVLNQLLLQTLAGNHVFEESELDGLLDDKIVTQDEDHVLVRADVDRCVGDDRSLDLPVNRLGFYSSGDRVDILGFSDRSAGREKHAERREGDNGDDFTHGIKICRVINGTEGGFGMINVGFTKKFKSKITMFGLICSRRLLLFLYYRSRVGSFKQNRLGDLDGYGFPVSNRR